MFDIIIVPAKRFYYLHLEDDKYRLLEDTGITVNKHRLMLNVGYPNVKTYIKLSQTNTLSNVGRLFEATFNRLPIDDKGYHIGKFHELDNVDFFEMLETKKNLLCAKN